ncbi:MAG: AI-2E family transporter [Gammaproteobacteria bacterium]|nr:AI-2E family transporter [Gammaproteobacteria bacterium]
MKYSSKPTGIPILITLAAFVVVVAGVRAAEAVVVPFLLSVFIAVISAPALLWLENKRVPRWLAMLIVLGVIILIAILISILIGSSIKDFSQDLPQYQQRLSGLLVQTTAWLNQFGIDLSASTLISYLNPGAAMQLVADMLNGLGSVFGNIFLILLTVVFILFEASSVPHKLRAGLPNADESLDAFAIVASNVNSYLAIKTITSVATGIIVVIALATLGVDYPLLWGIIAFLFNYIPNIGSIIAAVPAVLLALVQLGVGAAFATTIVYVTVNILIGSVIEPKMMGRQVGLSTLVVFLSLVFWGWVFGPVGMFLSVPLTMTAKIALESDAKTRWLAILLGNDVQANEQISVKSSAG